MKFKNNIMKKYIIIFGLLMAVPFTAQVVKEPKKLEEWSRPYKPFRIAGNLYYVGTYDLASYLIVTDKGNILINTGLADSFPIIKSNIQLYVDAADAEVLRNGGKTDYEMGKYGVTFKPVNPDYTLKDKGLIQFGNTKLTMLHHPGHTKGSCSFIFETKDNKRSYKVLIANMPTIIIDKKFSEVAAYPNIEKDYQYTLQAMKKLDFDIWVASHASQFDLHEKRKPKDPYNPGAFMNKKEYFDQLDELEKDYLEKKSEELNGHNL